MENKTISGPSCRFCRAELKHSFLDLGTSPLCNEQVSPDRLNAMEPFYTLHVYVCDQCFLVQLDEFVSPENIFSEYSYFSSFSDSWVKHAHDYAEMMIDRFGFNSKSLVTEIASNDGYLLQHFVNRKIPVLGVEPAANVAEAAIEKGIRTVVKFFGSHTARKLVKEHGHADLLLGNNVLAHVPNLNDFVSGMKIMLSPGGVITMEFPHLLQLIRQNQFDTIYHEHFSYFWFTTVEKVFAAQGLTLFDVEELSTHGGSLRIYGRHAEDSSKPVTDRVSQLKDKEKAEGYDRLEYYSSFEDKVKETKRKILEFLIKARRDGKQVVGYGAPGKGNTFLNYCGIRSDFLDYTVDRSPHKQNHFTPGTRIPICHPDKIKETKPDYILILPWNLREEIINQNTFVREWGCQFVVAIPEVKVFS